MKLRTFLGVSLLPLVYSWGLLSVSAAEKKSPAPPVSIVLLEEQIDASGLDSKKFMVKKFDELTPTTEDLPPAPIRDSILSKIGLQSYLSGMDELDRDLLLWNLYSYGEEITHKKFPKIPKPVLKDASTRLDD